MIESIQLIRNVGQFDSVSSGRTLPFEKLTMLYGENGRGKTTLAAILRSLATGEPNAILERKRLSATHDPHVVIAVRNGTQHIFQNGAWSTSLPQIAVFDDQFVAENVCSGIDIQTAHRQNLHELILGAQGVSLNAAVQTHVGAVEAHNSELRRKEAAIPTAARGSLTAEAFCKLEAVDRLDEAIQAAERNLAAAKSAEAIRDQSKFLPLSLPSFDVAGINALLRRALPDLDATAAARVQEHIVGLGADAESWVADGVSRVHAADPPTCPFCAQDLTASSVFEHYRKYFGDAYSDLKRVIARQIADITSAHGGDAPAAFERVVSATLRQRDFWLQFTTVPPVEIDTAALALVWKAAREAVLEALRAKQAAPLESTILPDTATAAIAAYETARRSIDAISTALVATNEQIAIVKGRAAGSNVQALTAELQRLKLVEARYNSANAPLCRAYLDELAAKTLAEKARDQARTALETYRKTVFPAYETAINEYLSKFGAGFRLGRVSAVNNRGGSSCSYNVVINNVDVNPTAANGPSFRNTLSAGDRNTLALAFFFTSLDHDPALAQKVVVIDDPMTSLDEHRSLTTVQELRALADRVAQVIVLSHSKAFLCEIWSKFRAARTAIKVARNGAGSELTAWDVSHDCITEHDKNHAKVLAYIQASGSDEREVARALRPILEVYMRTVYPDVFPPETLLGPFIGICERRIGAPNEVMSTARLTELRNLVEYSNRFHHETNPAYASETINGMELVQFCGRTIEFTRQ